MVQACTLYMCGIDSCILAFLSSYIVHIKLYYGKLDVGMAWNQAYSKLLHLVIFQSVSSEQGFTRLHVH